MARWHQYRLTMIPFFRKIRYQLAKDNQFFKYSRYAIGEIVLVVVGILIALQINTWKQESDNREEEQFYLKKLKDNFQQDTLNLNFRIATLDSSKIGLMGLIHDLKVKKSDGFSNRNGITELIATYGFYPEKSTFDNLTATGKLALLSNSMLVDSIHVYYNFISNRTQNWNEAIENYSRNIIAPYILDKVTVFQTNYYQELELLQTGGASPSELSEDLKFKNMLAFKINSIEEIQQAYLNLNRQAVNLIEMIDKEIDGSQ